MIGVRPCHPAGEKGRRSVSEYLGFRDLLARWVYTRQGLYKVIRYRDFPVVAFEINGGKTKVWRRADIETFEQGHPELLSEAARDFKVKGYYLTMSRDRKGLRKQVAATADADD